MIPLSTYSIYLASSSTSRQKMLQEVGISFISIGHSADETNCNALSILEERVLALAELKMVHAYLPPVGPEGTIIFVLSADTLTAGPNGQIYGKPLDAADARAILQATNGIFSQTTTGFCLDKKRACGAQWETIIRVARAVSGQTLCDMPSRWIDTYLQHSAALGASGALAVEGFGGLFVKEVRGSYSAIRGLPLDELREALEEVGFFTKI